MGPRAQHLAVTFVCTVLLIAVTSSLANAATSLWGTGSWCWFGDPRAVHVVGKRDQVIAGWIDPLGRVLVSAYDRATGTRATAVLGVLPTDDHSNPSLLVEPDNRITAFYSGHNGSDMYYRTTLHPEDVTTWSPPKRIIGNAPGAKGYTYPNPELLAAEHDTLYLFWRGGNWNPTYETRNSAGSWSRPRQLIIAPGQRPYVKTDSDGRSSIALAFTDGHPREKVTSVYFARYQGGWLRHADGRLISRMGARPIAPRDADLVYRASARFGNGWVYDVALTAAGSPVIVYETLPSTGHHLYWYARHRGFRWVSTLLTDGGPSISPGTIESGYAGGITLDHADPSVVYLSRKEGAHFEIERWRTLDAGASWRHATVTRAATVDNIRPVVPRGGGGLMWLRGHYGSYTGFATQIAYSGEA
jgi:hypothetical protein